MAISELAQQTPTKAIPGPSCEVCKELARIEPTEAEGLLSLLANPAWRYSELSERLREDEDTPLDLSPNSLARHARGGCAARVKLR